MAAHLRDDILHGRDHDENHASDSKWRHQESASYARHTNHTPRQENVRHGSKDLTDFLNSSRIETPKSSGSSGAYSSIVINSKTSGASSAAHSPIMIDGNTHPPGLDQSHLGDGLPNAQLITEATGHAVVECGPLLNYRRMENKTWFGSVLVVTTRAAQGEKTPELKLRTTREIAVGAEHTAAINGASGTINGVDYANGSNSRLDNEQQTKGTGSTEESTIRGTKLYSDPAHTFWRFDLKVPLRQFEIQCEYEVHGLTFPEDRQPGKQNFYVPAITESMRIMFHSCNGFSVGTDEEAFSGACLWKDVIRQHEKKPFHVMIGGGDQIYNDGIRVTGPLREWTNIANPRKRREYLFPESLREDCDKFYVQNYIRWYSTEPFASANGKIAQLNMWDDHDIIDGFGSYTDDFMHCPVFKGIGGVAHKYYLLFQHHLAPPLSTFTTDAPQTTLATKVGVDPRQLVNTFVLTGEKIDSSYIIGNSPGPYVAEHSRSIYARLGARIAFFGIDARTERTRHQVNYQETYEIIFARLREELSAAKQSTSPINHLIVLLGIPIAYPRLTWLENIFSSPVMGPMKFLNKRFGFGGSFFNSFDGSVDLLDDLDDHYTARTHKKERLYIVQQLQALAAEHSVRITILGGDVHLAAVGRFYSHPALHIPVSKDHRYMANIISSAIVNKPPPQAVANLLARRNKIHHMDQDTDETLMKYFDKDPGSVSRTADHNQVTMPSRNWAMITENSAATFGGHATSISGAHAYDFEQLGEETKAKLTNGHFPLHKGEEGSGTKHKAADGEKHGKSGDGTLDVCIRVEIDQHDAQGTTQGYGMTIPLLEYDDHEMHTHVRKRDNVRGAFNQRV